MTMGSEWRLSKLPLPVLEELYISMDMLGRWKELASEHLQVGQDEIRYMEYREPHGLSPSRKLITDWMNITDPLADELLVLLSKMRFYKAMLVIKNYVSPHLAPLLRGEGSRGALLDFVRRGPAVKQKELPSSGGSDAAVGGATAVTVAVTSSLRHTSSRPVRDVGAAAAMSCTDRNLNLNCTKEMMSTKLRADEVAALLDSKFGSKGGINTWSTLNNISCPGAPLPATLPSPLSSMSQYTASHQPPGPVPAPAATPAQTPAPAAGAAGPGVTPTPAATSSAASGTAAVAGPVAAPTPPAPPEEKELNAPTGPDETEVKRKYSQDVNSYMGRLGNIPQIPYKELESATDGWSQDHVLGSGGFGTVYRGTWKNTIWAVKRITQRDSGRTEAEQQEQMRQTLEELRILNSCRHDNILPLCGYSIAGPEPLLLYQFMVNGSLLDRIICRRGTRPLVWLQRHNIARGTARGLQYLHTRGNAPLIHGDIKSANILLDNHLEPKIGDFGLAREFPQTRLTSLTVTRVHGTLPYLPEEYLRSKKLSEKVDTYSFGVVLFELTTGLPAYDDKRPIKMLKTRVEETADKATLMDRKGGSADVDIFPALLRVGELCVSRRSKDRPDMVRVLKELDSITQARNLAARAQRISIEEAPSVEMSPLELQVLMDRRQHGGASPRPGYQPQQSGSPSPSVFSAGTAPPPYSEVVGSRYHQPPAPSPPGWPQHSPQPPHVAHQWQIAHSPQLHRSFPPQTPQFTAAQTPQFAGARFAGVQTPQYAGALTPQYAGGHSPPFPGGNSPIAAAQFYMGGQPAVSPQPAHAAASPHRPVTSSPPRHVTPAQPVPWAGGHHQQLQPWAGSPSPQPWQTALPTVLPHVLQRSSGELPLSIGGAECQLGAAPLLTALGVKSGSEPSTVSVADSQLSTDGSYVSDTTTQ